MDTHLATTPWPQYTVIWNHIIYKSFNKKGYFSVFSLLDCNMCCKVGWQCEDGWLLLMTTCPCQGDENYSHLGEKYWFIAVKNARQQVPLNRL
jgi:hypothetical protein